jgi:CRISPR-associated endonuclease/helicase Cas3
MAAKVNGSDKTLLNEARNNILEASLLKGESAPGFFSLAVPTGGGKTLASVGFALRHALKYKKERIIIAIPYTSIIEQTAAVYREVFGEGVVLEHHSNLDPETETRQSRLASENWDAPLIVTTNVQLFESLLASRTSSCRKLHNIANSVIILDEAQMLPSEYLRPILSLLRGLVKYFGVTVVFCTATQPALTGRIGSGEGVFEGISSCVDIVGAVSHLEVFQRYRIEWPDMSKKKSWPELAGELARFEQVLCVVNTRKDCRDLHRLMPDGTVHLSANMCGEHRSGVIACIKAKLSAGEKVRVISTQLVEAGVDIDFPVVYRALAGIDSVVQSAGRCNREGRLNLEGGLGKVIVFIPPELSPAGLLRKGEDVTREIIAQNPEPALGAELYLSYFRSFYRSVNGFDKPKFFDRMVRDSNDLSFQFRTFAQEVRLVDDRGQRSIIVYYKGRRGSSVELIDQLRRNGPEAWLLRKLQRFIVNIPLYEVDKLEKEGHIENVHGYYVQKSTGLYNNRYGLLTDLSLWPTDGFMV